ncbi:helix-turn-helix transcriptional regulator [Castellaniella sp.]|uniref:helix-turn-helix domain-containing protein n=1 Tax=Castellaniella sp. TaxID=1955812 RepID=UPI002AFFDD94|nr:helix-turn-helix transcriptional regulator [Castellaniella sp.]
MVKLTSRHRACLYWASQGKTSWEIGQILGITERTVNFHFGKLYDLLGVHTRQAAITAAVQRQLLDLNQVPIPGLTHPQTLTIPDSIQPSLFQ